MYKILHEKALQDELNFYLSYTEKGKKIFEPLCGLAVDTVADRCTDDSKYKISISTKTKEGFDIILKRKIL